MALLSCPLFPKPHVGLSHAEASAHSASRGSAQRAHRWGTKGARESRCAGTGARPLPLHATQGPRARPRERRAVVWHRGGTARGPLPGLSSGSSSQSALGRGMRAQSARGARQGAGGSGVDDFPQMWFEQRDATGAPMGTQKGQGSGDARRLGVSVTILGLATALQVALDGRLGGFAEGILGFIVQLLVSPFKP